MASAPPPGYDWVDEPQAPRIVVPRRPAPRTPEQAVVERGQAEAAPYAGPRAATNLQRDQQVITQSDTGGVNYSDENGLRSQYQGLPQVRDYQAVLPSYQTALTTSPTGGGDLNLVYSLAKIMDPGSVVRESEVEMASGAGSMWDRARADLGRISGGSGRLTERVRRDLRNQIQSRVENYRAAYMQAREDYRQRAERYGFDPNSVIGTDPGEAYVRDGNSPMDVANAAVVGVTEAVGGVQEPPVNAPPVAPGTGGVATPESGGITTTDRRDSAQARSHVADPQADPLERGNTDVRITTPLDAAYNDAWVQVVNSGADRAGMNQWLQENYQRFYPGANVPEVGDTNWRLIEESRRTGTGIDWQPNARSISQLPEEGRERLQEDYEAQVTAREGADARRAWAEENPTLARIDTFGRTAANTVTLGTANRISGMLSGRGAAYEHGASQADWEDRPFESIGGTLLGGSRLPFGQGVARQTGLGAAYSGTMAFNEADGPLADRLGAAYRGAAIGGPANAVIGGAMRAFRSPNADAVIEAGQRQNVHVPRYMTGRETAQVATGAVGATPGRIPLARSANRTINGIGPDDGLATATNRAAAEIGDVGDNFSAGRRAQSGAREFLDSSERRAAQHYDRIPIAPRAQANLTNTRAALDDMTQGLASNPRLSALLEDPQLIRYRNALSEGGLSWRDMKTFRTTVGRMIGRAQVAAEGTHADDLRGLYGALTRDMEATAAAQGSRALSMFRRANQYWRGREARREGVIQDILGRNFDAAPEDAFRMINQWARRDRGDTTALARTMRSLPRDDANAVRATIFARMGRATSGNQDETGAVFSPFTFATQWDQLEPRARSLLVPSAAHRRNLDDIALLASSMRRTERFTNTSNTGLGTNLGLFTLGGMTNLPAAVGAGVATYTLGRMLSSPSGSRSVLRALRNPEAFRRLVTREEEE